MATFIKMRNFGVKLGSLYRKAVIMKIPKLCREKSPSGDLAYVCINRKKIRCGKWGTPEAVEKYNRTIAEWNTTGQAPIRKGTVVTINELVLEFLKDIKDDYKKNGRETGSYQRFDRATKPLTKLYGSLPVDEFTPKSLITLRKIMIHSRGLRWGDKVEAADLVEHYTNLCEDRNEKPQSRGYINCWTTLVRRVFD